MKKLFEYILWYIPHFSKIVLPCDNEGDPMPPDSQTWYECDAWAFNFMSHCIVFFIGEVRDRK
jgi:hypothetical protein